MNRIYSILLLVLFIGGAFKNSLAGTPGKDTTEVNTLNKNGYDNRFTNPKQTVRDADKALKLAFQLTYPKGIAEAYRVKGIGQYYLNMPDSALTQYFESVNRYEQIHDEMGKAQVYNNIGNLYQLVDYESALDYFKRSQVIAEKFDNKELKAKIYLNIGNIYLRKTMFSKALENYTKSYDLFTKLNKPESIVLCLENIGVIYFSQRDFKKGKEILLDAHTRAKTMDMNSSLAAINMTLTDIYIAENNFTEAEKYIAEGKYYSDLVNNQKDVSDYKHYAYDLEIKRKDYKKANEILSDIYRADSSEYKKNVSTRLNFQIQEQKRAVNDIKAEKDKETSRIKFWAVTIAAGLLVIVIFLLVGSVRRKATTNLQLHDLNGEISRQKDNLDRINHHLEEIIDERTKDLQVKNKKLSEYSSYLSHQIRGPIATLKGLMNLEREGLVDQQECINMMDKCVSEIDEKIIEMSDMLHDPGKSGF